MSINNFDQSSSGMALELSVFRDTDRSQRDFEESFNRCGDSWVYTEFGNCNSDFNFADASNYQFTVKEFREAFKKSYDTDLSQHYMSKPFSKLTKLELIELLDCQAYDQDEISEFYQDNFTPLYDTIKTRGYCQGDYAEVIITPAYKKYLIGNGTSFEQAKDNLQTLIDHLFWDAPIYARLEINDHEYYLDELMTDQYDCNKDKIISDFITSKQITDNFNTDQIVIINTFLTENMPEYPDYC